MHIFSPFNQDFKALYSPKNIKKYPARHGRPVVHDRTEHYELLMWSTDYMIATLIHICALFTEMHDTFRAQLSPETTLGQVLRAAARVMPKVPMEEGDHYYCHFHSQDQEDPVRHVGPRWGLGTLIVLRMLGINPFDTDEQWNTVCIYVCGNIGVCYLDNKLCGYIYILHVHIEMYVISSNLSYPPAFAVGVKVADTRPYFYVCFGSFVHLFLACKRWA